jgi:hypothetical protein
MTFCFQFTGTTFAKDSLHFLEDNHQVRLRRTAVKNRAEQLPKNWCSYCGKYDYLPEKDCFGCT